MYQILADPLMIAANTTEVSQAIALGADNRVSIQVELNAATGSFTGNLEVILEGSNDLENWTAATPFNEYETTMTQVPSIAYVPTSTVYEAIGFQFVRLKYINGTVQTLSIRASINTSKL